MLIDAADAVDKWRERYERTQAAFQEKHVYVTRLEIRVADLERQIKKMAALEKRLTSSEKQIKGLEKALSGKADKPKGRAKASTSNMDEFVEAA